MVRTLLEFSTFRPTYGSNPRGAQGEHSGFDKPIYMRKPNQKAGLIKIKFSHPVTVKSHTASGLHEQESINGAVGLALITRDPVDAITSQLMRGLNRKLLVSDDMLRNAVDREVHSYKELVEVYRSFNEESRFHLHFKSLVSDDEYTRNAIEALCLSEVPLDL